MYVKSSPLPRFSPASDDPSEWKRGHCPFLVTCPAFPPLYMLCEGPRGERGEGSSHLAAAVVAAFVSWDLASSSVGPSEAPVQGLFKPSFFDVGSGPCLAGASTTLLTTRLLCPPPSSEL